jgi:hypothetical protein
MNGMTCRQQSLVTVPNARKASLGSIGGTLYRTVSQARVGQRCTGVDIDAIDEHQSKSHYLPQGA